MPRSGLETQGGLGLDSTDHSLKTGPQQPGFHQSTLISSPGRFDGAALSQGNNTEAAKRAAGVQAAQMARSGWVIGLGTGSTAYYAVEELGRLMREEGLLIAGVPTSHASEMLARTNGIPIKTLDDVERIDLAIDGADQVDGGKNLIKGLGGAHTREKIVASFADLFVVVVDDSKLASRLGLGVPVPLEVISLAVPAVTRRVQKLGGQTRLRMAHPAQAHGGPFITDQGNFLMDASFDEIPDPRSMERELNLIPGVVDNGLFTQIAATILVGSGKDGSVSIIE
ncbi:MAG: ribose-5-phosphate isomerase RpiA [Chloroflexi bacterium]|nr:ribose-5-phosphate isomerase RpiA [Chloroflexota bacterium]